MKKDLWICEITPPYPMRGEEELTIKETVEEIADCIDVVDPITKFPFTKAELEFLEEEFIQILFDDYVEYIMKIKNIDVDTANKKANELDNKLINLIKDLYGEA